MTQAQEEGSQRSVQDENDKGDLCWTEACEGIAWRMLKFLDDSEAAKVSVRELEEQVLSPAESRITVVRIARQAMNDKENLFQIFRQRENEVLIASKARWDEHLKGLIELGRRCLTFGEEVDYVSERQEFIADLMMSKNDMQKTAPENIRRRSSRSSRRRRSRGQKKLWRSYKRITS